MICFMSIKTENNLKIKWHLKKFQCPIGKERFKSALNVEPKYQLKKELQAN